MNKAYIKYILSLLLFGLNGIVASHIALPGYEIVLLRTFIGSLFLLVLFLFAKNKFTFYYKKKDFFFLVLSGAAMGTSWMFLYEAYSRIGVSLASLLYYCGSVIVMALSPFLFKEKLSFAKLIGFAAVLLGIVLINGNVSEAEGESFGLACGLLSAATYAVMVTANKKAAKISGMENALLQLIVSFITVAVFVFFKSGFHISIPAGSLIWILVLGLLNTGLGCYLYFFSIGRLSVQTVAILGYLEPLSAVLFSLILLNESIAALQITGAVFIFGGALFGECFGLKLKR